MIILKNTAEKKASKVYTKLKYENFEATTAANLKRLKITWMPNTFSIFISVFIWSKKKFKYFSRNNLTNIKAVI